MNDSTITLNKKNLAAILKIKLGLSNTVCEEIIKLFFSGIYEVTALEKKLILQNFGSFILTNKKSRPARNLQTGEVIMLEPRSIIRFVPAKILKTTINLNNGE